ncbi:MAG TPA: PIN domain-containing protein [Saprospiraceae bacterium]|mgnify:FL=1|nr:PIN domain-containing protein [Saprospiraceae bacterium]HRK81573.1 PIN domain-containing protein [Saprospiraceae bacterium]
MRIVLDINVLLISLPVRSPYRPIFDAVRLGDLTLLITNDILMEYEEKIAEKTRPEIAQNVVRLLLNLPNVEKIDAWYRWNLIGADADDNKYTDCAIAANAKYIVSDDAHFRVLKRLSFPKIDLLTSDELLEIVRNELPPRSR